MKSILLLLFLILAAPFVLAQPAIVPVPSPEASPAASPAVSSAPQVASPATVGKHAIVLPPEKAAPFHITRFEKPPVIDGKLDDDAWKQAIALRDFYQTSPGDNIEPSKQTIAWMGYDSKNLYFAFHCFDDPTKVRATVAKRDNVFGEDNVRVFLDTFNDKRRAYLVGWNPLGVQQDGIYTEGSGTDYNVDIVMESKGMLTEDGWIVEVAIPFKSLRYEAGKGKFWGIQIWRNIDRFNDEIDSWMPNSRDISGLLTQEGRLTGLDGISTERTLEIIPSLTVSETGKRLSSYNPIINDPGRMVNEPVKFEPGLTMKYGITPTVTLDLALNPDFAQVEADQTVLLANQRFPIFFDEKRPFFLEGIDIFKTPIQAVHTRAIVDPDAAVKLTGKRGRNSFGLLLASDNAPGNFGGDDRLFPQNFRFLDKNAYIGVLRLKRDIGKENSIGLLATTYNFIEQHNQLAGVDGRFKLDPQTIFTFQALASTSRRCFFNPSANSYSITAFDPCYNGSSRSRNFYRTGNGFAYAVRYEKNGRHFGWNFDGQGRTQDYRADVGFVRRRNTNREGIFVYYNSEPKPKAKLVSWGINNVISTNFDFQGRQQNVDQNVEVNMNFQHQTFIGFGGGGGYERLFEQEFGRQRTLTQSGTFAGDDPERSVFRKSIYAYMGTTPTKKYSLFAFAGYDSGVFDLDFGAGERYPRVSPGALLNPFAPLDPGAANALHVEASINYKATTALNMSLAYTGDKLVRKDTNRTVFVDHIMVFRSTYQFSRFTFARARIDYDTLASSVRGQFLLGYTPNPGTAFYVGYNDDLSRNGFNPFTGQLEPGFRRNGRTFFIKMSYLFRKSFGG